jgi:hypothetical protein
LHQGHGAGFDLISYLTQNISDLFAQFYDKLLKFFLDMNLSPLPKIIMWVRNSGPSTAGPSLWLCSSASYPVGKAYGIWS